MPLKTPPPPKPYIGDVLASEPKAKVLRVPVTIDDGYGNIVGGPDGYTLPVKISGFTFGGSINVDDVDINDGYGNPLGSVAGALNTNVTNDFIPTTSGIGDLNEDGYSTALAVSPSSTSFVFGFESQGIIVVNDSRNDKDGGSNVEFSFDNFSTNPGTLLPGDSMTMDNRRRLSIQLRSVGGPHPYRLVVWG